MPPDEPLEIAPTEMAIKAREGQRLRRGDSVGRYVVLDHIASGGMGSVYRAYDPELDRAIAVKLVRPLGPAALSSAKASARLLREAQALARVSHPNVIAVYDVGAAGSDVFIAMELVEGQTFRRWLAAEKRDSSQVLPVLLQAARGLAAAHSVGVIHRDFKPENVLVGNDGRVRVVDFGLANALEPDNAADDLEAETSSAPSIRRELESLQLTCTGEQLGTPVYMAPEQHRRKPVDERADQFAFCVTAYEALYGVRPFAGDTHAKLAVAKDLGDIRPPLFDAEVPAPVRDAIRRGLAAEPADRNPSMQHLVEALAPRGPAATRRWIWAAAAAVLLGGLVWGLVAFRSSDARATCTGAGDRVATVWGSELRTAVEQAFLASGRPHGDAAFRSFAAAADQHAEAWAAMHTEVCRATRVHGEQSEHLLDLRMDCLDRRLDEFAALVRTLARGSDGQAVDRSIEAVSGLPALDRCADTEVLLEATPLPTNQSIRTEVARVRAMVDESLALDRLGHLDEALARAQQATKAAAEIDYPPVIADAMAQRASLEAQTGDTAAAEASFVEAARIAADAGDRALAAEALVSLVWVVGNEQARFAEADAYANAARVAIAGVDSAAIRELYLSYYANLLEAEGRYEPALAALNEAAEIDRSMATPNDLRLARIYNDLGSVHRAAGHDDEAYAAYREALRIRERVQGAEHPDVGAALNNLSIMLRQDGKLDEAASYAERALAILETGLGPDHQYVSHALHSLALARAAQGKHELALKYFDRALSIAEKQLGPRHPDVADLLNSSGFSLRALNRYDAAQQRHRRALEIYRQALGPDHARVADTLVSLGLALILVYMVLACQYESLRDPLVVMLSVPVASTGVLLTLWLTHTTLNVQSYIGCIMLGGIVVNNAILLVDQAAQLRGGGMGTHEAVAEAGRRRLRPILMTTLTTILGLMPLALGVGEGAEAQAPLARAVIGGLTASTLITLVLIPVVYTLFHPDRTAARAA